MGSGGRLEAELEAAAEKAAQGQPGLQELQAEVERLRQGQGAAPREAELEAELKAAATAMAEMETAYAEVSAPYTSFKKIRKS